MVAVSKDKSALERLIKIMRYEDEEYYIYRCFSAVDNEIEENDGLYSVLIDGDVAWSCRRWFEGKEDVNDKIVLKYDDDMKEIYGTSHYISLDLLCEKFGIGVELFSEESGNCFQEHYLVNHEGEIVFNESVEWTQEWYDENNNLLDKPIEKGGFEYYLNFSGIEEIY
jgi:hypothetical protein